MCYGWFNVAPSCYCYSFRYMCFVDDNCVVFESCCYMLQGYRRVEMPKDHLSPPGSVMRLSDSDMSEFDIDDNISSVTGNHRNKHHTPLP